MISPFAQTYRQRRLGEIDPYLVVQRENGEIGWINQNGQLCDLDTELPLPDTDPDELVDLIGVACHEGVEGASVYDG